MGFAAVLRMRPKARLVRAIRIGACLVLLGLPGPAGAAQCGEIAPLGEAISAAPAVFIGVVEALAADGRWAEVRVEDVWRGPVDLPTAEVRGTPDPVLTPGNERYFNLGQRYLFVLSLQDGHLLDNVCSGTSKWDPDFARFRPADAVLVSEMTNELAEAPVDLGRLGVPAIAVGLIGLLMYGLLVGLRRHRMTRNP